MHKKIISRSLPLTLLAASLLTACGQAQPGGPGAMPPAAVDVVTLKTAPLQLTTELAGPTAAPRNAEGRPPVSGIIL